MKPINHAPTANRAFVAAALLFAAAALATTGISPLFAQTAYTAEPDNGAEVLTRGPVHEAFAEPNALNPAQGQVITTQPPADIEEIAPDERPDGDNVLWIPGYWSWDTDRSDFIWISGIWRDAPEGRSWVPGFWETVPGGYSWSQGFWRQNQAERMDYLPAPPQTLEAGPSMAAPSDDVIWTTGNWQYVDQRYAWRPGHYIQVRVDEVWVPPHYVWTRHGYLFVDGYWDRRIERRGVLFAPVYVAPAYYHRVDYVYSPVVVIDVGALTSFLFVTNRSHHYYFGDYYGDAYVSRGYRPWFRQDTRYHCYDPIYVCERREHQRSDPHWEDNQRRDYEYRREHVDARPPRTYAAQSKPQPSRPSERPRVVLAKSFKDYAAGRKDAKPFVPVKMEDRKSYGTRGAQGAKFRDERAKWESDNSKNARQPDNSKSNNDRGGNGKGGENHTMPMPPDRHNAPNPHPAATPEIHRVPTPDPGRHEEPTRHPPIPAPAAETHPYAGEPTRHPPIQPDVRKPDNENTRGNDNRGNGADHSKTPENPKTKTPDNARHEESIINSQGHVDRSQREPKQQEPKQQEPKQQEQKQRERINREPIKTPIPPVLTPKPAPVPTPKVTPRLAPRPTPAPDPMNPPKLDNGPLQHQEGGKKDGLGDAARPTPAPPQESRERARKEGKAPPVLRGKQASDAEKEKDQEKGRLNH